MPEIKERVCVCVCVHRVCMREDKVARKGGKSEK